MNITILNMCAHISVYNTYLYTHIHQHAWIPLNILAHIHMLRILFLTTSTLELQDCKGHREVT